MHSVFGGFRNSSNYLPILKNWMKNITLQMGMNIKTWQNPYNFANEYSGWMNCMDINEYQSILSAAIWFSYCNFLYYNDLIKTVWKIWGVFLWYFTLFENVLKKVIQILYDHMFSISINKYQVSVNHCIYKSWCWMQILYVFKVDCQILNLNFAA